MSSPASAIQSILELEAFVSGYSVFVGNQPNNPDKCITLYDMAGARPITMLAGSGDDDIQFPRLMIIVRGAVGDYDGTYDLARQVDDFIRQIEAPNEKDGYKYCFFSRNGTGEMSGLDEANRFSCSLVFTLMQRKVQVNHND